MVLDREELPLAHGEDGDRDHEGGADRHAFDVIRFIAVGIQLHADQGSELSDDVEHGDARSLFGVRVLVVDGPGDDDGDGGEEAHGGGEDARVAPGRAGVLRAGDGHDGIPGRGQ